MLNNLSIRKKLALIALGPLVLLVVLSALRIRGDLNEAADATDAQARTTVSALTGQLFEAVRVEAIENQNAVAIQGLDLDGVRADTDAAIDRWTSGAGEFSEIDNGELANVIAEFNRHRAEVAAGFATDTGAAEAFVADSEVLRTIAEFEGRLSQGASGDAIELRQVADLTVVSYSAAELQLAGMWTAHAGAAPDLLPAAIGAAAEAADSYGIRHGLELPVGEGSYDSLVGEFAAIGTGGDPGISANDWRSASDARATQLATLRVSGVGEASTAAADYQSSAQNAMRTAGLLALLGLFAAIGAILVIAKALTAPLAVLRDEARQIAEHDLPRIAEALSTGRPMEPSEAERPIDGLGSDEFADISDGLISIRDSAANLGENVASLQSGIASTYVNLARRNQSLVDRQLEAIDTLEAEERDSDRLAVMYRVDHLATRMRRNAESLLVLADAKTPERHSPAVELREVLRVAIGEVEDYRRIIPIALDDLHVAGHRAQDLAHLLAELMENAAQHSPPGTAVDVTGAFEPASGDYLVTILDHGTGLGAELKLELNQLLMAPPASTLTISHSIGMHVVSRLAHSLGLSVVLADGEDGGLIASVRVPKSVVAEWAHTATAASLTPQMATAPTPTAPTPTAPTPTAPTVAPEPAWADPIVASAAEVMAPEPPVIPTIEMPELELPSLGMGQESVDPLDGQVFEVADAFAPPNYEAPATAPEVFTPELTLPEPHVPEPHVPEPPVREPAPAMEQAPPTVEPQPDHSAEPIAPTQPAPAPVAETVAPSAPVTAAGLVRRQRSGGEGVARVDLNADRTAPSQRTPDQVKNMLSRYKTGLERGRGATGTEDVS